MRSPFEPAVEWPITSKRPPLSVSPSKGTWTKRSFRLIAEAGMRAGRIYGKAGKDHLRNRIQAYNHIAAERSDSLRRCLERLRELALPV